MNTRLIHIVFNLAKIWQLIVCWFLCFYPFLPFLPVVNLKLFWKSKQNKFGFATGKNWKKTEINKQMVVKFWFNCRKYGAIFYWLSCIDLRKAKELRFAVRSLKHELRLGLVMTYFLSARTPHAPRTHSHVLNVHKHIWPYSARLCVCTHVCVCARTLATHSLSKICTSATWSSLMATQESEGKPLSMGTKNWIQPDQCATKDIMQIRLKMLANMWAKSANWKGIQNILGVLRFFYL